MNQNKEFSSQAYGVEKETITIGDKIVNDNYLILDTIDTNKQTIGNETVPKGNSMQAMAVAEIKDEFKSYDKKELKDLSGYPDSVIKKEITIAYAGTSSVQDWKTNVREIAGDDKHANGAFQSALNYANEIEKKCSSQQGYTISTTGHSLGGAEAIYVAVLKKYNAITYGAAGSGLSAEQLANYNGIIFNLYDTSDAITSGLMTGGKAKIPFHSFGIDNAGWKLLGHSLDQFKVDKQGNYINKYGDIVIYSDLNGGISLEQTLLAQSILANKTEMRRLEHYGVSKTGGKTTYERLEKENKWLQQQIDGFTRLNLLRQKLTASGGGLSGNEQIYLDDTQALMIVTLVSSKYENAMESVLKVYEDGITELEILWQEGVSTVRRTSPDLSEGEIMEALESVGCSEQTVVTLPSQEFQEKMTTIRQMEQQFRSLIQEIESRISAFIQQDQELANQLF